MDYLNTVTVIEECHTCVCLVKLTIVKSPIVSNPKTCIIFTLTLSFHVQNSIDGSLVLAQANEDCLNRVKAASLSPSDRKQSKTMAEIEKNRLAMLDSQGMI